MKATMTWRCRACDDLVKDYLCVPLTPIVISAAQSKNGGVIEWYQEPKIIMAKVIPPDHVDDLPVVEPNQPDVVPVIPEPANPLSPPPPISDSEPEDVIEVEDTVEPEDETVSASVHEVGESSTASFHKEDSDGMLPGLMRRDINSLFGRMTSFSRRLCGRETAHALCDLVLEGTAAMENLVRKLGNAEERAECKKLRKELEEARSSNTLLRMQKERVERDLYWTRVQAHEFYREMIRKGFVFEERPNESIDVPVEDEESPSLSHPAKAETQGVTRMDIITTQWRLYRELQCINKV
ncbi:hypothetical protein Tco_0670743 [Tanacetum coccineum]